MSTHHSEWKVHSYLGPRLGVKWLVRRDVFAGVEYVLLRNGARRLFTGQHGAEAFACKLNQAAAEAQGRDQ